MKTSSLLRQFVMWQVAIVLVAAVAVFLLPYEGTFLAGGSSFYNTNPIFHSRANFDGNHYLHIALRGYGYAEQAFFPLYPRLVGFLTNVFNRDIYSNLSLAIYSGVVISTASFFAGLVYFRRLLILDEARSTVKWSILALLIFPTSFYFSGVYTEGLLFLLVILCFYYARRDNWIAAGIVGALATYTKFISIILFPVLLIEWWYSKRRWQDLVPIFLVPVGLVVYMFYLYQTMGDPLGFFHILPSFGSYRSETIILFPQVIYRYLKILLTVNPASLIYLIAALEFTLAVLFLLLSIWGLVKLRKSYAFFLLATFLVPTLTGSLVSLPRYLLISFPGFILLGRIMSKSVFFRNSYIVIGGGLFILLIGLFVRGYWVA